MSISKSELNYLKEVKENTEEIKNLLRSILETLEVLEDKYLIEQIRESEEQIKKGEYERFL
ncbi:hypothetical protein ABOONEI_2651 [Aciduliprofundum boonei T469]|nr:hypothetical protein ABOONEI_2651 [Aciduliprofundum boonei T469]